MILTNLIGWLVFGLIIGAIAKVITPGKEPTGWFKTIGIGVMGSYFGGIIKYLISGLNAEFSPSGVVFSVIGSVLFLMLWKYIDAKRIN